MHSEAIHVDIDGRVALMTIGAGPAPGEHLASELGAACEHVRRNDDVWVVVVTGQGDVFFPTAAPPSETLPASVPGVQVAPVFAAIEKPVIAAVNGDAIDQGLELALACDIRVASDRARFGLTQVERGTMPWDGGTQRLPRLIGRARATEMILTSRTIDASEALEFGLVTEIAPFEEVGARSRQIASTIASVGPIAAAYLKEAVLQGADMTLEQGLRLEADLSFLLQSTADRGEGIDSFLTRRKPSYRGQ